MKYSALRDVHSAVVQATDVNMRASNSIQSKVIGKLNQGERVKVLGSIKNGLKYNEIMAKLDTFLEPI